MTGSKRKPCHAVGSRYSDWETAKREFPEKSSIGVLHAKCVELICLASEVELMSNRHHMPELVASHSLVSTMIVVDSFDDAHRGQKFCTTHKHSQSAKTTDDKTHSERMLDKHGIAN